MSTSPAIGKTPEALTNSLRERIESKLLKLHQLNFREKQIVQKICAPDLAGAILRTSGPDKKEKPIEKNELDALQLLWTDWAKFQSLCKEFASRSTKKIYEAKDTSEFGPHFKAFLKMVKPEKGQHVLPGKTPAQREDSLYELVGILREIIAEGKELLAEERKKAEELKIQNEKERREAEETKNKEITDVVRATRKQVEGVHRYPKYLWGIDSEYHQKILGVMGKPDQIEEYYKTCFHPDALEQKEFEEIGLEDGSWKTLVQNPELLPEIENPSEVKKMLNKTWQEDLAKRKKYYEVMRVRNRMQKLEDDVMGVNKLAHASAMNTDAQRFERELTWGKFMEKIMCLFTAEKWQGDKNVKVVPVDANMDIYGKIDLILEITTSGRKYLKGIDFTIQKKPVADEDHKSGKTKDSMGDEDGTTKDMRPQVLVKFNADSAKKMLSKELLDQNPGILEGKVVIIPREVKFNSTGMHFREALLVKTYKILLGSPDINKSGLITKIYRETRSEITKQNGESIEDLTRLEKEETSAA